MKSSVIIDIVNNDLCIGCGICAALCPEKNLTMQWNQYGEYNPSEEVPCSIQCGVCLKVCPFADGNNNEDDISKTLYGDIPGLCHRSETGYYLDCYAGFAQETRNRGSSGGMATWLLSTLLKKEIVDHVIVVIPNEDPDQLFKFAILSKPESVLESSGSVYYPVELSGVIREILNRPGKYAIIGVPCFIKAIRLAAQKNNKIKESILVTIGLVCEQVKNKNLTAYFAAVAGLEGRPIKVYYRGKDPGQPANNFFFSYKDNSDKNYRIFWNRGISEAWDNRWFTPNACNYCDDIFAECADVALMDAWLPEYYTNYKGTNLILVRSEQIQMIITEGIKSEKIYLDRIPVGKIIESQKDCIAEKRINIAYRMHIAHSRGITSPKKRVRMKKILNPLIKADIELKQKMQQISRQYFATHAGQDAKGREQFREMMTIYIQKSRALRKVSAGMVVPVNVYRYIKRYIHG